MKRKRVRQGETWYSQETAMTRRYVKKYYRHQPIGDNTEGVTIKYDNISLCHDMDNIQNSIVDLFVEREPRMCMPKYFMKNSTTRRKSRRNTLFRELTTAEFCIAMQKGMRLIRSTFS